MGGTGLTRPLSRILAENPRIKRHVHSNNRFFQVSTEVHEAVVTGKPVVALESTIYTHGFPYPDNLHLASRLEHLVRDHGGIPATVGILDGVAKVGLTSNEIKDLISSSGEDTTLKISRRDLAYVCGLVS
jgi:pseudouridine-5'-phosphate glycosidase/pseudouridine kinase